MVHKNILAVFIILFCIHLVSGADKADIHVSPSGSDKNPGTAEKPLKTISRAAEIIQPGQTCLVRPGTYRENVSITVSGTAEKPIRFIGDPTGKVVISGTEPVTGKWKRHKDKMYKKKVRRTFSQLFADNKMMIEARWPDMRFKDILNRWSWANTGRGSRYGKINDSKLAATGIDWTGARITLNVAHQFFSWTRTVSSHKAGSPTLTYPKDLPGITHYANKTRPWEDDFYYLSGKLEALNRPGEWYLDKKNKLLYLYTLDGDSPENHTIEIKTRDYGLSAKEIKHVMFSGFEFAACTVDLQACEYVTIDECHLLFPTYSPDLTDMGKPQKPMVCTRLSGEHNSITNSSIAFSNTGGFTVLGSNNLVENCMVHSFCWNGSLKYVGIRVQARPGMKKKETGKSVIRRCSVYNAGNSCVAVYDMPEMVVEYCDIHDGGKACKDVSLLYTHLPLINGTVFRYNWVYGNHASAVSMGIRGDDQTRGLTVHHNVVWNAGWYGIIAKGDNNRIYNNTVLESKKYDILLRDRPEPKKPWRKQWPLLKKQNMNTECYNNYGLKMSASSKKMKALTCGHGHNYSRGKKVFMNKVTLDFMPCKDSPLIDAGKEIEGITNGFKGKAPDIGAYESGGEKWKPGTDWPEAEINKRKYRELVW